MLRRNPLLVSAIAACMAAPAAQATNGYFAHGYGTASKALGGAGVALPLDSLSAATNPANMVWVGKRLDVGAAVFSPRRKLEAGDVPDFPPAPELGPFGGTPAPGFPLQPGTQDSNKDWFLIPSFGYNLPLDEQSSVGVSAYGNGGMNTNYSREAVDPDRGTAIDRFVAFQQTGNPFDPNFVGLNACQPGTFCAGTAGIDLSQLFLNFSYSRKINDKASWGAGLILAGQAFEAKGLSFFEGFTESAAKGQPVKNLTNNGHEFSFGGGLKVGVQGEVVDGLSLGASYQSKIWFSKLDDYSDLFANGGEFDIPPTATIGLAWKPAPKHTIVADYQWIWYEKVDAVSNENHLDRCMAGQIDYCLGGDKGAGFGWDNMGVFKIGWQYEYSPTWTFRLGYNHGANPISSSQILFNTLAPATVEDHFTAGFTQKLTKRNQWSLELMYAKENSVSGPNTFTGDPSFGIPSQDLEISMYQFEVEASFGFIWD